MGWRERDWARFDADERDRFFGGSALQTNTFGEQPVHLPLATPDTPRNVARLIAVGISLAITLVVGGGVLQRRAANTPPPPPVKEFIPDEISVDWRAGDFTPATSPGTICLDDPRHGRICAGYAAGEQPATALSREITRRRLVIVIR